MRKKSPIGLEVFILLATFCFFSSLEPVSALIPCGSQSCGLSKVQDYFPDSGDGFPKSNTLEPGKFDSAGFDHDVRLSGGGGSGHKGGYKGSGKGHGYGGSKGSGGYKGSKGSGGYEDSQGKKGSTGSKGAQDESKVEKEKNEDSLPAKDLTPQQVNH